MHVHTAAHSTHQPQTAPLLHARRPPDNRRSGLNCSVLAIKSSASGDAMGNTSLNDFFFSGGMDSNMVATNGDLPQEHDKHE